MVRPDSAGRPDYTESVPTELLLHTLSSLSFDELLPLLALNRRWRTVAIDSTPYWSFIELTSLRAAAVNLFVTRISPTKERPVELDVYLDLGNQTGTESAALQATVLSTLRGHLHHTLRLSAHLRLSDAPALWTALDVPAPQLRFFYLRNTFLLDREPLAIPASNLFAGDAPALDSVILVGIDLPGHPLPAFSQVTKLDILYGSPVPDVFLHFPALDTVGFPDGASFERPAFHTARSYRNIRNCVWRSGSRLDLAPLPLAPTRDVEAVTVYYPGAQEIVELVAHLRSPISLTYKPDAKYPEEEFELVLAETDNAPGAGRRFRVMIDVIQLWQDDLDRELWPTLSTALDGKLHTLEIDAPRWETFARCMPALPGLQCVRITVPDEGAVAAIPRAKVPSPELCTLELVAPRCTWIAEEDILDFAVANLDAAALVGTTLSLDNIHIHRGQLGLAAIFKDVRSVHSAPCRISPDHSK